MEITGNIRKMESVHTDQVHYHLPVGGTSVAMNPLIGSRIDLEYQGKIHCIRCGKETRKSFAQGYCYPCFISAPETEECVLRPELCRAHEGVARDMAYASTHCLIEHVVYLSLTSGLKVGVTRGTQVPTRWIDQGAVAAIELARTPNRYEAGLIEVALKSLINDKTNWRKMLSDIDPDSINLRDEKQRISALLPTDMQSYVTDNQNVIRMNYPVESYPEKVKSLNLDKDPVVARTLAGVKGQYLIFQDGSVINLRKFGGYLIRFRSRD
ncbi:MAG: DUF2797 domain-containing protein [Bacteroidales bacterium]